MNPQTPFIADLIEQIYASCAKTHTSWLSDRSNIDQTEFFAKMTMAGYESIAHGSFRTVFTHCSTPDVVYKFGQSRSNFQEFEIWENSTDEIKKLLCPLLYSNGLTNVMSRVRCTVQDMYTQKEYEESYMFLPDEQQPQGPTAIKLKSMLEIGDLHMQNFGVMHTGQIVVIDYGWDYRFTDTNHQSKSHHDLVHQDRLDHVNGFEQLYSIGGMEAKNHVHGYDLDFNILHLVSISDPGIVEALDLLYKKTEELQTTAYQVPLVEVNDAGTMVEEEQPLVLHEHPRIEYQNNAMIFGKLSVVPNMYRIYQNL
jgi:hypothetical protein